MARRGRMCVVEGCERRALAGSVVCNDHRGTALGEETSRQLGLMTQRMAALGKLDEAEEKRAASKRFRQQVARGDYAAVFSTKLVAMLDEASEKNNLKQEIGALHVGIMRLLVEEENPSKMAHALAKLTFAMGRAMQLQATFDEREHAGDFDKLLTEVLGEWEPPEVEPAPDPGLVAAEEGYPPLEWPPLRSYELTDEFGNPVE